MPDEWFDADDRVVPPIVRFAQLPVVQTGGENGAVQPTRELLHARKNSLSVDEYWHRLDQTDPGIALHQPHELHHRVSADNTVGIEHHHVAILAPPPPAKIRDVAGLLVNPATT